MKVKKLVKALKAYKGERIPIVAVDDVGREFHLQWKFIDDGPDWAEFSFVLSDNDWPVLDTDMAKAMLDYAYSSPDNKVSLFGESAGFLDYRLRVMWPCDRDFRGGCGWSTKDMVLEVCTLPQWKDEDYDQEAIDKKNAEIREMAERHSEEMDAEAEEIRSKYAKESED